MKKWYFGVSATVLSLTLPAACGEESAGDVNSTEETAEAAVEVPDYSIAEEGDLSIGGAERWEYWVVPDDLYIGETEIEAIIADVLEQAKEKRDLNAVVIWIIDDERQVGNGYTIAKAEYATEGDWAKAVEVDTGDYSSHELVVDMGSNLSGKIPADYEAGTYPTEEELDVYFHWHHIVFDEGSAAGEEAVQKTADELGLSYNETDKMISKVNLR